jgi:hypothetical protein
VGAVLRWLIFQNDPTTRWSSCDDSRDGGPGRMRALQTHPADHVKRSRQWAPPIRQAFTHSLRAPESGNIKRTSEHRMVVNSTRARGPRSYKQHDVTVRRPPGAINLKPPRKIPTALLHLNRRRDFLSKPQSGQERRWKALTAARSARRRFPMPNRAAGNHKAPKKRKPKMQENCLLLEIKRPLAIGLF